MENGYTDAYRPGMSTVEQMANRIGMQADRIRGGTDAVTALAWTTSLLEQVLALQNHYMLEAALERETQASMARAMHMTRSGFAHRYGAMIRQARQDLWMSQAQSLRFQDGQSVLLPFTGGSRQQ